MFGTTYFFDVIGAAGSDVESDDVLLLPVAGVWLFFADGCTSSDANVLCALLALHAITHTVGSALLIYGVAAPRKVLVRDYARFVIAPAPIGKAPGAVFRAIF
jgi:hypothetical protein